MPQVLSAMFASTFINAIIVGVLLGVDPCIDPSSAGEPVPDEAKAESEDPSHLIASRQILIGYDFAGTTAGALQFLRSLNAEQGEEAAALIEKLGSDDFATRVSAHLELLKLPTIPHDMLLVASKSENPEVRWRSQEVLNQRNPERVVRAALEIIVHEPKGARVEDVLAALPWCKSTATKIVWIDAMEEVITPQDLPKIFELLKSDDDTIQGSAIEILAKQLPPKRRSELYPYLTGKTSKLSLKTCEALANLGDPATLMPLVQLLDDPDTNIRQRGVRILRCLTGKNFDFAPTAEVEQRKRSVERWHDWVNTNGETATLSFPLRIHGRGHLNGNMLVTFGSDGDRVVELNSSGREVWGYDVQAWNAKILMNGNIMIASSFEDRIIEVNRKGEVVWEADICAICVVPLENGNFLIADSDGNRAVEMNRDKEIVWEQKLPDTCIDVDQFPNGDRVLASGKTLYIVSSGRSMRKIKLKGDADISSMEALLNGNFLITDSGKNEVYEVTRQNHIRWRVKQESPYDAYMLPDGSMLVSGQTGLFEYNPNHRLRKRHSRKSTGSARK